MRIGKAWGLDEVARDMVRRALVLLSDHELNPSTFAVRVCASTGASLPAALLAGMATLSGYRHGNVARLASHALTAALDGHAEDFVNRHNHLSPYAYGFGHPLYPRGDPRAAYLLRRLPQNTPEKIALIQLSDHLGLPPNIDSALAVLTEYFGYPEDAATRIFSIGRLAGWIAHAIEQAQNGSIIRPRAQYQKQAKAFGHI